MRTHRSSFQTPRNLTRPSSPRMVLQTHTFILLPTWSLQFHTCARNLSVLRKETIPRVNEREGNLAPHAQTLVYRRIRFRE